MAEKSFGKPWWKYCEAKGLDVTDSTLNKSHVCFKCTAAGLVRTHLLRCIVVTCISTGVDYNLVKQNRLTRQQKVSTATVFNPNAIIYISFHHISSSDQLTTKCSFLVFSSVKGDFLDSNTLGTCDALLTSHSSETVSDTGHKREMFLNKRWIPGAVSTRSRDRGPYMEQIFIETLICCCCWCQRFHVWSVSLHFIQTHAACLCFIHRPRGPVHSVHVSSTQHCLFALKPQIKTKNNVAFLVDR